MLRINEKLLISHPEFSLVIQRKNKLVILLDKGLFFKQYHIREDKVNAKQPAKTVTKVAEVMAWHDGKRVGFGTREYNESTRWIRLAAPAFTIYAMPDNSKPTLDQPPPSSGIGLAAADVTELSGLVNKSMTVTITE